jgi:CcmD family protein
MNPGPQLGLIAVVVAYTIVFAAIFVFVGLMARRRKRLERRLRELRQSTSSDPRG